MATRKIVASVTLHVPAKGHKPFEFDALGNRTAGAYSIVEVKPGQAVEVEAEELIARDLAKAYEEPKAPEMAKATA